MSDSTALSDKARGKRPSTDPSQVNLADPLSPNYNSPRQQFISPWNTPNSSTFGSTFDTSSSSASQRSLSPIPGSHFEQSGLLPAVPREVLGRRRVSDMSQGKGAFDTSDGGGSSNIMDGYGMEPEKRIGNDRQQQQHHRPTPISTSSHERTYSQTIPQSARTNASSSSSPSTSHSQITITSPLHQYQQPNKAGTSSSINGFGQFSDRNSFSSTNQGKHSPRMNQQGLQPPSRSESQFQPRPKPKRFLPNPGCTLCTFITTTNTSHPTGFPPTNPNPTNSFQPTSDPPTPTSPTFLINTTHNQPGPDKKIIHHSSSLLTVFEASTGTGRNGGGGEALASGGRHLVGIVGWGCLGGIYELGPVDIPSLTSILSIFHTLLDKIESRLNGTSSSNNGSNFANGNGNGSNGSGRTDGAGGRMERRIGFVSGNLRDPKFPYAHLHLHAILGPFDLASWYRKNMVYGWLNWYELEDLIAEIRESTSNNRIKSGYGSARRDAPITQVLDAGSQEGLSNALDHLGSGQQKRQQYQKHSQQGRMNQVRETGYERALPESAGSVGGEGSDTGQFLPDEDNQANRTETNVSRRDSFRTVKGDSQEQGDVGESAVADDDEPTTEELRARKLDEIDALMRQMSMDRRLTEREAEQLRRGAEGMV